MDESGNRFGAYLDRQIASATGRPIRRRTGMNDLSGGCIHRVQKIDFDDGASFVIKSHPDAPATQFSAEAEGLEAIAATGTVRVPRVVDVGSFENQPYLVLEFIVEGPASRLLEAQLGSELAELHLIGQHDQFGFPHANFLGSSEQPNDWSSDWSDFFVTQRLELQLRRARGRADWDATWGSLGEKVLLRSHHELSAVAIRPSLIHGDLWSGNWLCDDLGRPVLIDPACYYAHREAEFGMISLFGGLSNRFDQAYQERWPFEPGWQTRIAIYRLYHLLNHFNLFGNSYRDTCMALMHQLASV